MPPVSPNPPIPTEGQDLIGTLIGGYRIVSVLGTGAMGVVYLAEHQALGRHMAVKVLLPAYASHPKIVSRFLNEAKAVSQIRHPNIVEVHDFSQLPDGTFYLVMEYVEGLRLRQVMEQRRPLGLQLTAAILMPVASALSAAHRERIVHRDVKPDNIMVQLQPGSDRVIQVKLLDFGIAKLLRDTQPGADEAPMTVIGTVMGTPKYMSPEQARGDVHLIGPPSDIYALGVIIYECLTGRPPFVAARRLDYALKHNQEAPPPMDELAPLGSLRHEIEAVVMRCLQKRPQDRFQNAAEIETRLGQLRDLHCSGESPYMETIRVPSGGFSFAPPAPGGGAAQHVPDLTQPDTPETLRVPMQATLPMRTLRQLQERLPLPPVRRGRLRGRLFKDRRLVAILFGIGCVVLLTSVLLAVLMPRAG